MTLINKTIYPIIPVDLPDKIIKEHYTLNAKELEFTVNKTINSKIKYILLFFLKLIKN